mgnify:CR=1 FL=1
MFLKGNFLYTPSQTEFIILEKQYIQIEDGKVLGFFQDLPANTASSDVVDYGDDIIIQPSPTSISMRRNTSTAALASMKSSCPG